MAPAIAPPQEPRSDAAMKAVVALRKLEALFGSKAHLEYPTLPYKENLVTIESEQVTHKVWLQFMPGCGYAQLRLVGKPFSFVRLDLFDIKQMRIHTEEGRSTLLFKFARGFTSDLTLYVQNPVMLSWGNDVSMPIQKDSNVA